MSSPVGPGTLDTHEYGAPLGGDGIGLPALDRLGSADLVVWRATGPLAPVMPTETERRFRFRSLPQAVGAARRVLRAWEEHFEPDLFYDLSLCVSELVTNRVRQGGSARGDEIELVVRRSEKLVRAEVRESRPDVLVKQPLEQSLSDWGIFIVDRVADRWGVDRGQGTVVWCEIDLASDGRSRNAPPLGATLANRSA
jgi:anti-sigma regulatory factor (Ser/Thr protein kinase)